MDDISKVKSDGYFLIRNVYGQSQIEGMRRHVLQYVGLMGRTRDNPNSFHLAGFHRFPEFSALHSTIASNRQIHSSLSRHYINEPYRPIGLSDITVNRSQQWHTDLLRGRYSAYLAGCDPWGASEHGCVKVLIYLQSGKSLRIVPGSHVCESPLDDSAIAGLPRLEVFEELQVNAGDVVLMDIRTIHRGATDAEMSKEELVHAPEILVSTVFGSIHSPLAQRMEAGNVQRNADWDRRYLSSTIHQTVSDPRVG